MESTPLAQALEQPNGARFYRCALQVNPYAYLIRHSKPSQHAYASEADYNHAIVEACKRTGVEAIAVTDHFRVDDSWGLTEAAQQAGVFAFLGFEAATSEGVHLLCLYGPDQREAIERYIGELGIRNSNELSPVSGLNCLEVLRVVRDQGGVVIAAHACSPNGILKHWTGQPRIYAWQSPDLLACAIPGTAEEAPQAYREILLNKDPFHRRERPLAIIQANDVNSPEDLVKPQASCFLKMGQLSVEGLRQSFLDPESRVRLADDQPSKPSVELEALAWEGGFLDGQRLRLNGGLNVLIGGRGAGKSTVIESLRYVLGLEPLGADASKAQQSFVRHVLKSGTKISLLAKVRQGAEHSYVIERTAPDPPAVKDPEGRTLNLAPLDALGRIEVFGQHEIAELVRNADKLALLLERFAENDPHAEERKSALKLALEKSRARLGTLQSEMLRNDERLSLLPGLEETEKRFQAAGLEEMLREKSLLVREERLLRTLQERLDPLSAISRELTDSLPLDGAFISAKALDELPNAELLTDGAKILAKLDSELQRLNDGVNSALQAATSEIEALRLRWNEARQQAENDYQARLRQLQRDKIDGDEFISLRRQIESLQPLRERQDKFRREWEALWSERQNLLNERENLAEEEFRRLERAAKSVSKKLKGRVQVQVMKCGDLQPLDLLLQKEVGGVLKPFLEQLARRGACSPHELAEACRSGPQALIDSFGATSAVAERIAQKGLALSLAIEELELPATTRLQLNTAAEGEPDNWRDLEALSAGQKATAVLLLLLLESKHPLIVDQPEDDLDNRFITEGVVPLIRREKSQRQLIFSTHNANIPVLGDAELIVGLTAEADESTGVRGRIAQSQAGSIDMEATRRLVEETLEGGKAAFELRRQKYGF